MSGSTFRFCVSARRVRPLKILEVFDRAGRRSELMSVFGFLSESPLNGGRPRQGSLQIPPEEIEELNREGVGYAFTLTSLAAAPEHLRDRWTNEMLRRFENPLNSVIVATPLIENYLREKYPRYTFRASCLCNLKTPAEINEACRRFDMVTPWPEMNDHEDQLRALDRKDKVMLFGTQVCLKRCGDFRMRHYFVGSLDHIAYYNHREYGVTYHPQDYRWHRPPAACRARENRIEVDDLDRLRRLGFTHIKIVHFDEFAEKHLGLAPELPARWRRALRWAWTLPRTK